MLICQYCPILCDYPAEQHAEAFERFLKYKTRVPVRGAILLNEAMDAVILVKGWKKNANWSFPRGKINKEEPDLACAVREVYEETGYDLEAAGLVGDGEDIKSIEVTMREQSLKLFVFRDVPTDTHFEPRTRKEISKIQWYKLSELPTIKKNKQQQEEKGEALANNANKFYMVAPFLGHLKKWIAQQRKIDKSRTNHRATIQHNNEASAITDVEDQHAEDGAGSRGDIEKLLDAHRQRSHKMPKQAISDLPEVSQVVSPPAHIDIAHASDTLSKIDLLAILKGGNKKAQDPPPQTPTAQMIEEPVMPHSPPHHHLSRMPTLPSAPSLASLQRQVEKPEFMATGNPQTKALQPLTETARVVPQARHLKYTLDSASETAQPQVPALYNQARDSHKPNQAPQVGIQGPSIPPADNLPKPILSQQKSSLLDLFKKRTANEPIDIAVADLQPHAHHTDALPTTSSMAFVPPQVLSRSSTEKVSPPTTVTNQKANLLAMFKTPSAPQVTLPQETQNSLQLPPAPVELSAAASPGHSREPSTTEVETSQPGLNGYASNQKQPSPVISHASKGRSTEHSEISTSHRLKDGKPRVGATINGPLNIPQFDMIPKHHRDSHMPTHKKTTETETPTTITILPRPGSSHVPSINAPSAPTQKSSKPSTDAPHPPAVSVRSKQKPPSPKRILTPVKAVQPPTPNLEAQSTPTKPFHPQILKRPVALSREPSEMSPIQPLPSPKQALPDHRTSHHPASTKSDHKKSLLSLFTAPSPLVSPPSANTADTNLESSLASSVSPKSDHRETQASLHRQASSPSSKENKSISTTVEQPLDSLSGQASGGGGGLPTISTSGVKADGNAREGKLALKENNNENEEKPERRPSARETPNELKNLLLGKLANIKV